MKKNYYLFAMLLLGGMITHSQVNAKPVSSHAISKSVNTSQKQSQTNSATEDTAQDEPVSRPQIGQILFSGNTKIPSSELQKAIPLKEKDIANENIIMDSMVKIAQLYKMKNIKVTISPILEKISPNLTNIHFDIHETSIENTKN